MSKLIRNLNYVDKGEFVEIEAGDLLPFLYKAQSRHKKFIEIFFSDLVTAYYKKLYGTDLFTKSWQEFYLLDLEAAHKHNKLIKSAIEAVYGAPKDQIMSVPMSEFLEFAKYYKRNLSGEVTKWQK